MDEKEWMNKGISLAKLEKYEEAIEAYEKAIELNPKDDRVMNYFLNPAILKLCFPFLFRVTE